MAKTLSKISSEELRKARAAGFGRKKPKKPKASATLGQMEAYCDRWNTWVKDAKDKVREKNRKESENKKRKDLLKKIRSHS